MSFHGVTSDGWLATWDSQRCAWVNRRCPTEHQELMHMGKRVWDREAVPPLWALDRPVVKQGEKPPTRLVQINQRITRQDQPGLVYHNAQHLKWRSGQWIVVNPAIVTGPSRVAAVWRALPTHPEYQDARKRVRLAAQLGTYITVELPEGYR